MSGKTDGPPGNTGCCWHLLPFLSGSITVQYSVPHKAQLVLSFNLSGFSFLSDEWKHILDLGLDLVVAMCSGYNVIKLHVFHNISVHYIERYAIRHCNM